MAISGGNSFKTRDTLNVGAQAFDIHRLEFLEKQGLAKLATLPFSLRVLLENLLRFEDNRFVHAEDIKSLASWTPGVAQKEIAFMPARVLLQDFTGVPAVVDFATMREAMKKMGGNPKRINPLFPAELVIDHSVQVDHFGGANAFGLNAELEFQRNVERYAFLRWGQTAFQNFKVVPPDTGICHQVNLEYLARVVCAMPSGNKFEAYPDSVVGTDSHTTMVNALGVFGWGVGGIEAEAAMLGQPSSMLIPEVVGFRLHGKLSEGATATDLVLTVTEMLRKKGVVGKFVEFYGTGLSTLSVLIERRSPTWLRSMARRWASSRSTPKRSPISNLPAARTNRSHSSKPTARNNFCSAATRRPIPRSATSSSFEVGLAAVSQQQHDQQRRWAGPATCGSCGTRPPRPWLASIGRGSHRIPVGCAAPGTARPVHARSRNPQPSRGPVVNSAAWRSAKPAPGWPAPAGQTVMPRHFASTGYRLSKHRPEVMSAAWWRTLDGNIAVRLIPAAGGGNPARAALA